MTNELESYSMLLVNGKKFCEGKEEMKRMRQTVFTY